MANTSIIFERIPTVIDELELDVSLTEQHDIESDITEHPVEAGYVITDHVRRKPQRVTIEGFISNTPISLPSLTDPTRTETAYSTLMAIFDAAKVISIVTRLKQYDNMVIESLRFPRDKSTTEALRFTACCKEIRVATSQTVAVTQPRGAGKKHSGKKTGETAPAPVEKPASLLFKAKQYVGSKWASKP